MMLDVLKEYIISAGDFALRKQSEAVRSFKADGTVVTQTDTKINEFLRKKIKKHFPDANIITEELDSSYDSSKEYTFVLDPLDGTDAYSMGMPCWCVSLGVLKDLIPVGGLIYAPAWGVKGGNFLFADIAENAELNGKVIENICKDEAAELQIMVPSNIHRNFDLSSFPGKVRNTGSSVINITAMLFHPQICGAVINRCYIWDMAAAHAVIKKCGFDLVNFSGSPIDYAGLVSRERASDFMISGSDPLIKIIRENFIKR